MMNKLKKSLGIDISDYSIEALELQKEGSQIRVLNYTRVELEEGLVLGGRIKNPQKLKQVLLKALSMAKPKAIRSKTAVVSLPDSQVYVHTFKVESAKSKGLKSIIEKEIRTNIPILINNLNYAYKIKHKDDYKKADYGGALPTAILFASPKEVLREWQLFFSEAGIDVDYFDIESQAIFRGLYKNELKKLISIVDFGSNTSNLSLFNSNGLVYTHSIMIGGKKIFAKIAQDLRIDKIKAEKLLKKEGLNNKGELRLAVVEVMRTIWQEIKQTHRYYEKVEGEKISEIIFVGGISHMPGFLAHAKKQGLGQNIVMGEAIFKQKLNKPYLYIQAIGLARSELESTWAYKDSFLSTLGDIKTGNINISKIVLSKVKKSLNNKVLRLTVVLLLLFSFFQVIIFFQIHTRLLFVLFKQRETELVSFKETIKVVLPLTANGLLEQKFLLTGEIITSKSLDAKSLEKAIQEAENGIKAEIGQDEIAWPLFSLEEIDRESLVFPLEFNFLVFSRKEATNIVANEAKKIFGPDILKIGEVKFEDIDSSKDFEDLYILTGEFELESKNKIKPKTLVVNVDLPRLQQRIIILNVPSGLKVREGAGFDFKKIAIVYQGQEFVVKEKTKDWTMIILDNSKSGWVYSAYTEEIKKAK